MKKCSILILTWALKLQNWAYLGYFLTNWFIASSFKTLNWRLDQQQRNQQLKNNLHWRVHHPLLSPRSFAWQGRRGARSRRKSRASAAGRGTRGWTGLFGLCCGLCPRFPRLSGDFARGVLFVSRGATAAAPAWRARQGVHDCII